MSSALGSSPPEARVLIIDDEPAILFSAGDYFAQHGVEVDRVADARSARQRLAEREYAVVVADLMLAPRQLDPVELVAEIRESWPRTQVIVFTGCGSERAEERARALGVFAYVHKPVPLSELFELVRRALARGPQ